MHGHVLRAVGHVQAGSTHLAEPNPVEEHPLQQPPRQRDCEPAVCGRSAAVGGRLLCESQGGRERGRERRSQRAREGERRIDSPATVGPIHEPGSARRTAGRPLHPAGPGPAGAAGAGPRAVVSATTAAADQQASAGWEGSGDGGVVGRAINRQVRWGGGVVGTWQCGAKVALPMRRCAACMSMNPSPVLQTRTPNPAPTHPQPHTHTPAHTHTMVRRSISKLMSSGCSVVVKPHPQHQQTKARARRRPIRTHDGPIQPSLRRDCHSAAPPSPSSRRFNMGGEGLSAK